MTDEIPLPEYPTETGVGIRNRVYLYFLLYHMYKLRIIYLFCPNSHCRRLEYTLQTYNWPMFSNFYDKWTDQIPAEKIFKHFLLIKVFFFFFFNETIPLNFFVRLNFTIFYFEELCRWFGILSSSFIFSCSATLFLFFWWNSIHFS